MRRTLKTISRFIPSLRPSLAPNAIPRHAFRAVLETSTFHRTMSFLGMSKRLCGKTILITGASSGIGKSTAVEFSHISPGDLKLILTARRLDTLKEVAEEIKKDVGEGVKVLPVKLDISNADEVRNFIGNLPEEFKDIDVLINNA